MTTTTETPTTATPQPTNDGGAAPAQDVKPDTASGENGQNQQPAAAPETDGATLLGDGAEGDAAETKDEGEKPEGAPEKYEWAAPEGVTLDESIMGSLSEVAKELNLSQDAAQKLVDKMAPAMAQRQAAQVQAMRTEWRQASSSDQEFGGAKLTENMAVAKKALDAFGTPEFRQLLEQTGMGNHPEVIRTFYRAGKAISEDGLVSGSAPKAPRDARSLFPASNMNP
mgnify:CR=1 FL=1